jgi:hypothetical protein
LGARLNYSLPLALYQQELLECLFTDFYSYAWILKWANTIEELSNHKLSITDNLFKRRQDELPDDKICSLQWQLFLLNFEKKNLSY